METPHVDLGVDEAVSLSLYLDDAREPFATYRPPASVELDTTTFEDGPHELRIEHWTRSGMRVRGQSRSSFKTDLELQ